MQLPVDVDQWLPGDALANTDMLKIGVGRGWWRDVTPLVFGWEGDTWTPPLDPPQWAPATVECI